MPVKSTLPEYAVAIAAISLLGLTKSQCPPLSENIFYAVSMVKLQDLLSVHMGGWVRVTMYMTVFGLQPQNYQ